MKKKFFCIGMSFALLWPVALLAQPGAASNEEVPKQKAIALFYNNINDNAGLYNGSEYIMYDQRIKGTPYFLDGSQQPGDVYYNGTLYPNVTLIYETTTESVVVREFGQGIFISLVNEKVNYFNLLGHTFVHLRPDSSNKIITNGFYDRLYNGPTAVYAKRQKTVYEDPRTFEKSFVESNHYYLNKDKVFYEVDGKNSVLSVFKSKKKDILKYIRQNDISYKKDPETAIVKMAEYYDKLTH